MTYPWAHLAADALPRFLGYVSVSADPAPAGCDGPCLLWTGGKSKGGGRGSAKRPLYGYFGLGLWMVRAHIFMAVVKGLLTERGLTVDHLCKNSLCVNTDHFELVTRTENCRRRWVCEPVAKAA